MNKDEMAKELLNDLALLKRFTDTRQYLVADMFVRKKMSHITDTWKSPKGNLWTWMCEINKDLKASMTFFTTINSRYGRYVFKPQITPYGFIIIVYLPHFFKRYRERTHTGTKLTTMQLIRRYFRRNNNAVAENRGKGRIEVATAEGVGLGNFINLRTRLLRTFITRDMAYGSQENRFHEQEEQRRTRVEGHLIDCDEVVLELTELGLSEETLEQKWKEYLEQQEKTNNN